MRVMSADSSSPGTEVAEVTGRTKLPVPQPEKVNLNLWSYLKQCIGRELSKITMPVHWNEPLSLLQRITEYMNYSHLLMSAPALDAPLARLQQVATFAVSALASNNMRMGKPFNPLLGETYQLEQDGFRIVCEQVGELSVGSWLSVNKVALLRSVITLRSPPSTPRPRGRSLCSTAPSTPRPSSGGRVWSSSLREC